MRYRIDKNKKLSEIGIGGYALSGVYGEKDTGEFVDVVRTAHDKGVTFFDVADIYGPAEEILGKAVAPFRDRVWVATKVGWSTEGKPDCSFEHILASCDRSLERLGTDYIDLYQIHFNDPATPVEETLGALEKLRSVGKIRHYGIGHLPPDRMEAFFSLGNVFSALVELSAVSRSSCQRILPVCQQHGVHVIGFSTTGRGLLTGKIAPAHTFEDGDIRNLDPLFQRERFDSGLRVLEEIRGLGERHGKTPVQVAISWVLAQPGVICALTGPSTEAHLVENLGASAFTLTSEDLRELEEFFEVEDSRLHVEQIQSIRAILTQPLDELNGFTDLVYVLETLVETGQAKEEEILPFFLKLMPLRGKSDEVARDEMRDIHSEAHEQFVHDVDD
jgi:aryl-alcohol dehydrogenase-like predicted oxidoreductase